MATQTTARSAQAELPDARRWLMLVSVLGATLMTGLDFFIVNVAVPSIQRDLHASFAAVQLVAAGYIMAYAVVLATAGRLGDLYGRKRVFLIGVCSFTFFSALCGFAPNVPLLIGFRVVQGATGALMAPQVVSFIQVSFAPSERPAAMSAYAATVGLASLLGLVLGGVLLAINIFNIGWRSIFLINIPLGLIVLSATGLLVRESRQPGKHTLDIGGVGLLTLSLALLIFPLLLGNSTGWPLWSKVCLPLSVPCLLAFLAYEHRVTRLGKLPLISLGLFRIRQFTAGVLTTWFSQVLFTGMLFLFSIYLQTNLHLSPLATGLAVSAGSIAYIIASGANTLIMRRLGKQCLSIAAGGVTLGYLLLLLTTSSLEVQWGLAPVLVAFFVLCFSEGLLYTPLMHISLEKVSDADVGVASGVYTTALQTSNTMSIVLVGLVFAVLTTLTGDTERALAFTLILLALLSLGVLLLAQLLPRGFGTKNTSR